MFSLGLLLRTLAAPWKQTVNVAGPNTPLQVRLQWWLGNQISRVVGFFVRLGTLLAGIVILAVTGLAGGLLILLWPLLPATSLGLVIIGLVLSIWM